MHERFCRCAPADKEGEPCDEDEEEDVGDDILAKPDLLVETNGDQGGKITG